MSAGILGMPQPHWSRDRAVRCPDCRAEGGQPCRLTDGVEIMGHHAARTQRAAELAERADVFQEDQAEEDDDA